MSSELFDYIQTIKPSFGDEKRAKVGLLLIHYITLARVSNGHVRIDNVLTASGNPFVRKVLRNASLVRDLAFAMKVDMTCAYDDSPVPEGLRRTCERYHIDVEACIHRNRKLSDARGEMWDLIIFVRVARAIMAVLHEDTLGSLDESYRGHRPVGFKPKSKWLGLRVDESVPALRARDLPRAGAPRAVSAKTTGTSTSTSGPVPMSRKTSDGTSASWSSGSSGSKSIAHKRRHVSRPMPIPVTSLPRTMQQGAASRRMR